MLPYLVTHYLFVHVVVVEEVAHQLSRQTTTNRDHYITIIDHVRAAKNQKLSYDAS